MATKEGVKDAKRPTGFFRLTLAFLTAICVALICRSPEFGPYEPISMRVYSRDPFAEALFFSMGSVLTYVALRLWDRTRPLTSIYCVCAALCLVGSRAQIRFR